MNAASKKEFLTLLRQRHEAVSAENRVHFRTEHHTPAQVIGTAVCTKCAKQDSVLWELKHLERLVTDIPVTPAKKAVKKKVKT